MSIERSKKAAEKRVQGFLQDYDEQWRRAAPAFEARDSAGDAFETWRQLTQRVARDHFVDGASDLSSSFGTPPEYGVAVERIVRSEVDGDRAYVLTEVFGSPVDMLHEFTLARSGFRWRIAAIAQHFDDPTGPFVREEEVRAALDATSTDAPLDELPEPQSGLDEERNFSARSVVPPGGDGREPVTVDPVGTLVTASGALAVIDFGYDNDDARPLARRVTPGEYPVERVTVAGRVAAVRVRLADRPAVAWHPASQRPGQGHVIGVDAGCVCVVDYPAYAGMSRRAKAERYDEFGSRPRPSIGMFPLGEGQAGVATESGYGDGGYPVLWGVDADGAIVQLVVDFMVLVADAEDGRLVHL